MRTSSKSTATATTTTTMTDIQWTGRQQQNNNRYNNKDNNIDNNNNNNETKSSIKLPFITHALYCTGIYIVTESTNEFECMNK